MKWEKITKYRLDYVLLCALTGAHFTRLQWNNYIGDPDGFYHAKIAIFIKRGLILKSLPWMQFTTLKDSFTDHHWLYHLFLIPFTYLHQNPLIAVKIATVVFAVASVLVFYWLLKKMKISYAWLWATLFITLEANSFRFFLVKANSLSLLVIWLLIYALFKEKTWLLFILGFIYVWLYGGWPLALLIFIVFLISRLVYKKLHTSKLKVFWARLVKVLEKKKAATHSNLRLFLYLIAGLIAGLIINPYWPRNIYFYYQQVWQIGVVNFASKFSVGGEWYPMDFLTIITAFPHIFILACILIIFLIFRYKKASQLTWFSFLSSFIFLILTMKSRRYIEYLSPFLLLFVASAFTDFKHTINKKKLKKWWNMAPKYVRSYLVIVLLSFLILVFPAVLGKTWNAPINTKWNVEKFLPAAQWLGNNTMPGSTIFHDDWDNWPALFYHNDKNYYLVGLDPTFMYNFDTELHQSYVNITTGVEKNDVAKQIQEKFQSNFVFIEKENHQEFINNLMIDGSAQRVYEDEETIIFKILLK